jgi:hypothetical protein
LLASDSACVTLSFPEWGKPPSPSFSATTVNQIRFHKGFEWATHPKVIVSMLWTETTIECAFCTSTIRWHWKACTELTYPEVVSICIMEFHPPLSSTWWVGGLMNWLKSMPPVLVSTGALDSASQLDDGTLFSLLVLHSNFAISFIRSYPWTASFFSPFDGDSLQL